MEQDYSKYYEYRRDYYKKKNESQENDKYCEQCNKRLKYSSYSSHVKTTKHLINTELFDLKNK